MALIKHLNKAPIIEAVIDIRVEPGTADVSIFGSAGEGLGPEYRSNPDPLTEFQAHVSFDVKAKSNPAQLSHRQQAGGFRYTSVDGKYLAAFKPSGLTFSRLPPYTDWNDVFEHGRKVWSVYLEMAKPKKVKRLGLRFINRLIFPVTPLTPLAKFLEIPVKFPSGFRAELNGFFTRTAFFEPKNGIAGLVMFATENQTIEGSTSIIFDIDAFMDKDLSVSVDLFHEEFEKLHQMKNEVFFSYLTEEAVDLFQ
jgi:uncharacterized protein (TIGR04255 family)